MTEDEIRKMHELNHDLDLVERLLDHSEKDHKWIGFTRCDSKEGGFWTRYFEKELNKFLHQCKDKMEEIIVTAKFECKDEFKG